MLILACLAAAPIVPAAPNQATKDRCTAYAQRAVQQYRLMKSHPECQANTDPLTWQDSYDNHYNGCLIFPEPASKFAEAARDNHLQACGALSDPPANVPSAAGQPETAKEPATATLGSTARCPVARPSALPSTGTLVGQNAVVKGGTLSFRSFPHKGQVVSYSVVRPIYIVAEMQCTGRIENTYGPWITFTGGPQGPQIFYVNLGGTVSGAPLSPVNAAELLQK